MKCTRCGAALPSEGEMCQSCGSQVATDLSRGLSPGDVIAERYVVGEELASGGMGRVYWAEQRPLGSSVCVKTLHTGASNDPQFAARFEREARTTSQLRHPNIVSVFDFGTLHDGTMYLVMEYVEGVSLATLAPNGRTMSARRAVRLLGQVCDALAFAHDRGVIHRDLKPANIMVVKMPDGTDYVKVLDFGSALMLEGGEEAERLTRVGTVIGTPAYMAPEYILGRGVDARIDVYAVGVLLYSLLTGAPPFRGNAQSVFAQQVSVPPEAPRRRNPRADCSEHLERVILKALVKDPAKRFGSAAELKQAMEKALGGDSSDIGEVEQEHAGGGVEVAHSERSVVLMSVKLGGGVSSDAVQRARQLIEGQGGVLHRRETDPGTTAAPPAKAEDASELRFVFGLDRDVPEAASEAMRCAMRLADQVDGREMRVGVHDAQASCKGRFDQSGFSYELFGEGATLAATMSSHAQPGETVVSGPAARYVPPELTLTPIMPPEHVDAPVFALTDPVRSRGKMGRYLSFIGREEEQRQLLEVAVGAKEGNVCVVEGPSGIGKSRLVQEIVAQAAQLDVLWSVVAARAREAVGPAHPASLLAALGWTSPGGGASTTERYAVDLMLGRYDRLEDDLTGERRQLRLVSAAIDGVVRRLEQGPVVVVLDELHAADDLTWGLARRLVDMASDLGASVVLCVRDAEKLPFALPVAARRIRLGPLSAKEVRGALGALER
ncbi:MAG: protein kinase domain-containing protein, partial [Polyangiales bacterium]